MTKIIDSREIIKNVWKRRMRKALNNKEYTAAQLGELKIQMATELTSDEYRDVMGG